MGENICKIRDRDDIDITYKELIQFGKKTYSRLMDKRHV